MEYYLDYMGVWTNPQVENLERALLTELKERRSIYRGLTIYFIGDPVLAMGYLRSCY